ncbi:unnamed protein product [Rangifer tarandus platyrhynchus]|uniref:Uncharacterized protein n=1 Tax=Rangifer tarandus platyrhynchus TaxID=3082113 RepID=A0ABN8ZGY7_RANTA|nr:unnamed protein product [Rangifer tarandus platyrhynchus]
MAEPGCALLPVLPSDSPHPQRLVSGNVLEAWLASLAESSVSTPFCLRSPCGRRGCALRPPSQGVGSAEGRASRVSRDVGWWAAAPTGPPPLLLKLSDAGCQAPRKLPGEKGDGTYSEDCHGNQMTNSVGARSLGGI